jgi:hypothetical protein
MQTPTPTGTSVSNHDELKAWAAAETIKGVDLTLFNAFLPTYTELATAARALLAAYGGDVPDWLRAEAARLEQAASGAQVIPPDLWHLFYIEAHSDEEVAGYLASAQSGSEQKAEELARAALEDELPAGWDVTHSSHKGIVDRDIFERLWSAEGAE